MIRFLLTFFDTPICKISKKYILNDFGNVFFKELRAGRSLPEIKMPCALTKHTHKKFIPKNMGDFRNTIVFLIQAKEAAVGYSGTV